MPDKPLGKWSALAFDVWLFSPCRIYQHVRDLNRASVLLLSKFAAIFCGQFFASCSSLAYLVRFENKYVFLDFEKWPYNPGVVAVK
jgi:hypothetical protein